MFEMYTEDIILYALPIISYLYSINNNNKRKSLESHYMYFQMYVGGLSLLSTLSLSFSDTITVMTYTYVVIAKFVKLEITVATCIAV